MPNKMKLTVAESKILETQMDELQQIWEDNNELLRSFRNKAAGIRSSQLAAQVAYDIIKNRDEEQRSDDSEKIGRYLLDKFVDACYCYYKHVFGQDEKSDQEKVYRGKLRGLKEYIKRLESGE